MPRVSNDIEQCVEFIALQSWGKPADRLTDILQGIESVQFMPKRNAVKACRRDTGVELRCQHARQSSIVYAYFEPDKEFPNGVVSVRAVRHGSVKSVFAGVKESLPPLYG